MAQSYRRGSHGYWILIQKEAEIDALVANLYKITEDEYLSVLKETDKAEDFRRMAINAYQKLKMGN